MNVRFITVLLLASILLGGVVLGQESEVLQAAGGQVNFNFDRVDLRLLVKLVGDMTGRQFVMDDKLKGQVTVVTPRRIPQKEVYPLFLSILEANGYSVVQQGALHRIVTLPRRTLPEGRVVTGDTVPADAGIITKVIHLEHISAIDVKKLLDPMVGDARSGALAAFGPSNHLVITDTADNIRRMEAILAQLDKPGSARVVEVIQLHYASADEVASQIMQAMRGAEKAGTKLSRHVKRIAQGDTSLPTDVVVVPASHANSLVIVGSPVEISELKQIVGELDRESEAGRGPLNPIFLKYLSAEQASKSLNALLDKSADKDNRRVAIEPSLANNALLVSASPRDFEWVQGLVAQLDQVPQQVLVEILIAEVTVGKNLDLGVEWSTIEQPEDGTTTFIGRSRPDDQDYVTDYLAQGVFPQGFMIGVARGTYVDANGNIVPKIPFLLKAMSQDSDINILSSIPLWAQNNTEASVSVVDNIPLLKSTIEGGAGTARDVIQNIDRMDVGIKLTLTPHVNPDGEVLMELNPSIEAITDEGPADQPFTPTISKREVTTTVTVPDKATIAITGLIREDMVQTVNKVPLLGDIPLLGHLFRNTSRQKKRTNLLIFVTPHIVTDMREALEMKKAWEEATQLGQVATNVTVRTSIGE